MVYLQDSDSSTQCIPFDYNAPWFSSAIHTVYSNWAIQSQNMPAGNHKAADMPIKKTPVHGDLSKEVRQISRFLATDRAY